MSRKKISKNKNTAQVRRERDPIPWRYCFLTLLCGLVLVGGFFFAARQHFSSIDYGIKNSQLRKQKDELVATQRQLLLAKEVALSPQAIKKVAKEIGLTEIVGTVEALYTNKETTEKPKSEKVSDTKTTNVSSTVVTKKDVKKTEKETKTEKKSVEETDSKNKKGTQQAKLIK